MKTFIVDTMIKTEKKFEKKKWVCSQCEQEIEYNTRFYDRAKEILTNRNIPGKAEWNDLNKIEKADIREVLEEDGLFPTVFASDGRAHLCEVKSTREEIENLKLKVKKVTSDLGATKHTIKKIQDNILDIKGQLSAIKKQLKTLKS